MAKYNYTNFSWLLNIGASDFLKPVTELSSCKNVYEDAVWVLKRERWYSKFYSNWQGLWNVIYLASLDDWTTYWETVIAWINNWTWLWIYEATWAWLTNLATTASRAWAQISWTTYLNRHFIVWYDWTDSEFLQNATVTHNTYSESDWNLTSMPQGKFIAQYRDLLYVLNTKIWSDVYPSRAYYNDDPVWWAITWTNTTNFLSFGQNDWDYITCWIEASDKLVVFKQRSMWTWNEENVKRVSDAWCESPRSLQVINGVLYWLNRDWIWRWDWALPQLISWKVQGLLEQMDMSKLSEVISIKNWLEYRVYIWDINYRWNVFSNCWIVFDARREKFRIRCTSHKPYSSCSHTVNWVNHSYFWTAWWYVEKFAKPYENQNSDDWYEIDYMFETNLLDFWAPDIKKFSPRMTVFSKNPNGMKYVVDADNQDSYREDWGQIIDANVFSADLGSEAYRYRVKFYGKDSWTPFEFEWITVEVKEIEDF